MNTPDDEAVQQGTGRTRLVVGGVILIALVLLVIAIASDSGDDEPSADAANDETQDTADDEVVADDEVTASDEAADDSTVAEGEAASDSDPAEVTPIADPIGLGELCVEIRHQPVDGQESASGIWVRGEVYGLDGGWIWVEGPTINNGEPVQIPVEGNQFEGGLGINNYGAHEIESFRISDEDTDDVLQDATDLLDVFDGIIPVDADEGSPFDTDCFQFDPPVE